MDARQRHGGVVEWVEGWEKGEGGLDWEVSGKTEEAGKSIRRRGDLYGRLPTTGGLNMFCKGSAGNIIMSAIKLLIARFYSARD